MAVKDLHLNVKPVAVIILGIDVEAQALRVVGRG